MSFVQSFVLLIDYLMSGMFLAISAITLDYLGYFHLFCKTEGILKRLLQRRGSLPVIPSIFSSSSGPMPTQVFVPGAMTVLPASVIKAAVNPASLACRR